MSMGPYTKQTAMEINYRPEKSLSWYQLLIFSLVVIQKVRLLRRGRGGEVIEKQTKMNMGRGPSMCVHSLFLKKMLRFSKWSFIDILQFFLLIIMAVWNIKQTIMKDYNIQSCQWMACDRFRQPFLLCTTFRSFLCTVHYFLCIFSKNGYLFIGYR